MKNNYAQLDLTTLDEIRGGTDQTTTEIRGGTDQTRFKRFKRVR